VRKSGNRTRISVQLVKVADSSHLWSETYDRTLEDIFAVQDDIAKAVAQALQVTLLGRGTAAKNPDAEAYDLVLQAHYVMQLRTSETIHRAREMLERALKISPEYAPAWAEMGLVHQREKERAQTVQDKQSALDKARQALAKALELDPELAVAHSRMAGVQQDSWEFEAAERSTARALAADTRNPIVLANAALAYQTLGRLDDAIRLQKRALELDPLNLTGFNNLASSYINAGQLDEAEALCNKALELRPDNWTTYWLRGEGHLLRGEVEKARADFAKFTELSGQGDYWQPFGDALLEHTAGNEPASRKATEEFETRFGAGDPATCAELRAWRGEADAAFAWLDKALAARDPYLAQIKTVVLLKSLHADPRWGAFLKKMGFEA
jgi:tetratricopeptide (TPR) repeat protein